MAGLFGLLDTIGGGIDTLMGDGKSDEYKAGLALARKHNDPRFLSEQYTLMNQKMESDFEDQKYSAAFDAAEAGGPGTEVNLSDYEVSATDRWKAQIDAMMGSEIPALQEQGLKMMQSYQSRATERATGGGPTTAMQEYQYAVKRGDFDGTFTEWKLMQKTKGTTINIGDKGIKSSDNIVDADGKPVQVPVGMTVDEAREKGWRYADVPTAAEGKQAAAIQTSAINIEKLKTLIQSEGADLSGIPGLIDEYRAGGTFGSATVNSILEKFGVKTTPENVEALSLVAGLSNQLLAAYRGAQVGPKEQIMFEKQLPMPGQPAETFMANLLRTQSDLARLNNIIAEGRNFIGSPLYTEMMSRDSGEDEEDDDLPPGATGAL